MPVRAELARAQIKCELREADNALGFGPTLNQGFPLGWAVHRLYHSKIDVLRWLSGSPVCQLCARFQLFE